MTGSLLTWTTPDATTRLQPGCRLAVVAADISAARDLRQVTRHSDLQGRPGWRVSRPDGCKSLVISADHRLLAGQDVMSSLRLTLALARDGRRAGDDADTRRCRQALARVQTCVPLPAEAPVETLSLQQQLAAQWATAWLLPHDLVWLDRPGQELSAREREQLLALSDAHRHDHPLRAQVLVDLTPPSPDWAAATTIFWEHRQNEDQS
ncbi:MAG: hypothetical protein VW625_01260 [Perlucidibaca sp.]